MLAADKVLLFWACPDDGGAALLLPLGEELGIDRDLVLLPETL